MDKILRLADVPLNQPLPESLFDADGKLLMRKGTLVSAEQLKALALKGLRYLELGAPGSEYDRDEVAVATMEPPARSSSTIDGPEPWQQAGPSIDDDREVAAHSPKVQYTAVKPIDPAFAVRMERLVSQAADTVAKLGKALTEGTLRDATPIRTLADDFLKELKGDADQTVAASLRQFADQELSIRSVQMSVLSMAIAKAMKLDDADQATVGAAALLHDMALFELPEEERSAQAAQRPVARHAYESHPTIAYEMLEPVRDVDGTVRLIVLQVHEQADGSGFPRRITMVRTHRLARVVNVADAYLTLIGCGAGSQQIMPADALAYLMHHSCAGRFDSAATCGLVRAVSLYPLGSMVMLSNARTARVVRTVDQNPACPVVAFVDVDGSDILAKLDETGLKILRPLDEASLSRRRLPATDFEEILW